MADVPPGAESLSITASSSGVTISGLDASLVNAVRLGDRDAFTAIVQEYGRRIYRAAFFIVRNIDDASDITQETFARAYRNISRFDTSRPLFPWLRRIARNLALNLVQRTEHRVGSLAEWETTARDGSPAKPGEGERPGDLGTVIPIGSTAVTAEPPDVLLRKEEASEVRRAIENLSPDHRDIIVLKHFEECSYAEIAEILNIPLGTVMSRLYAARTRLRELLLAEEK